MNACAIRDLPQTEDVAVYGSLPVMASGGEATLPAGAAKERSPSSLDDRVRTALLPPIWQIVFDYVTVEQLILLDIKLTAFDIKNTRFDGELKNDIVLDYAIRSANVMRYLKPKKIPWGEQHLVKAIEHIEGVLRDEKKLHDQIRIIDELCAQKCPLSEYACGAAAGVHLIILQHLRLKFKCPWDERVYVGAALANSVKTAQWALENGCPLDESTIIDDARSCCSTVEMVEWFENAYPGCDSPKDEYTVAGEYEPSKATYPWCDNVGCFDLSLLIALRVRGYKWSEQVLIRAIEEKEYDVVRWAWNNGAPRNFGDDAEDILAEIANVLISK